MSTHQALAVSNAVSGDRTFMEVQFPLTGDYQTDLMSGILALMEKLETIPFSRQGLPHFRMAAQVFLLLEDRMKLEEDCSRKPKIIPEQPPQWYGSEISQGEIGTMNDLLNKQMALQGAPEAAEKPWWKSVFEPKL